MTEFTPLYALLGGAMIGAAALILMWFNGSVAGVSGIVSRAIIQPSLNGAWRWAFILGLVIGPMLASLWGHDLPKDMDVSWTLIIIGGLLVGMGTKLGSGCTSGHGICGIGRGASRSIVATIIFMSTALITVYVMEHIIGGYL